MAAARFATGPTAVDLAAASDAALQEDALADMRAAKAERDRVRNLIQSVADEAGALEQRMAETAEALEAGEELPVVSRARAMQPFVITRSGSVVAEVNINAVIV